MRVPVPVWNGSGAGIRGDAGDRIVRQRIHRGFRITDDFRLGTGRAKERGNYKYLKRFELPAVLWYFGKPRGQVEESIGNFRTVAGVCNR